MTRITHRFSVPARAAALVTAAALFAGAGAARYTSIHTASSAPQAQRAGNTAAAAKIPAAQPKKHRWYQLGLASWYGAQFQGRTTASGEEFDMNDLTAAHRNLPLGTLLRVTNLRNHRAVVVRVNDRGPVPQDRIIDLSYAAAQRLSFEDKGLAHVKLEVLPPNSRNVASLERPRLPGTR